jgi:hypothetical protein
LWNRRKVFLDGPISPQRQRIELSQTPMSSPTEYALATLHAQQAAQQLPSPHTEQEALQQPLQSPPKNKEALQLSSPPTKTEATKDKEASLVKDMPPPSSSPYDTIHDDLALYKTRSHSDPTNQFFAAMRNLKSLLGTSSAMFALAQHAETYLRACEIESYEENGEVYNREKLLVRPYDPIFMKEHVPEKFMFGKSFLTAA